MNLLNWEYLRVPWESIKVRLTYLESHTHSFEDWTYILANCSTFIHYFWFIEVYVMFPIQGYKERYQNNNFDENSSLLLKLRT